MANVMGSWSISGTTATYTIEGKVAAKVTGLPTGTTASEYGIDGVQAVINDTGEGKIRLNAAALKGASKVSVTSGTGYSCTLELANDVTKSEFTNITSTVSNGTLTINGDIPIGYKLAADGKSVSYISTAKVNQKLASVAGLNTGLKKAITDGGFTDADGNPSNAITISDTEIKLTEDALADKNVSLSLSNGSAYKLVADDISEVKLDGDATVEFTGTSSKTATVKGDLSKGYIVADNKFTFQAEKKGAVLAKITGLGAEASSSNVELEDSSKLGTTITIGKDALAKAASLTLSNGGAYILAFASSEANQDGTLGFSTGKGNYWVTASNGTKATYKIDTDEGWAIAGTKINYTAAKTTTLATLSGLLKGTGDAETAAAKKEDATNTAGKIYDEDAEAAGEPTIAGISVSGGVITLDNRVLGTTKVTVGAKENYTLAIDTTSTNNKVDTTTAEKDLWAISGTTATFKTAAPTHYSKAADGKSIIYTATSKGSAAKATVKGLAKDLVVGTFDEVNKVYAVTKDENTGKTTKTLVMEITKAPVYESNNLKEAGVITLYKGAQATTNISVGAKEDYILVLDKSEEGNTAIAAPATSDEAWTYKNGVATLNAIYEEGGFTLSADSKNAIYTKPSTVKNGVQQSQKILEIKGLNKDAAWNTATGETESSLESKGITVTKNETTGIHTVTISASALSTGNVTITNANYKLKLDNDVILQGDSKVKNGVDVWRINGTTAVYEKVIPAYYEYDAAKNTVIYHKETVAKDKDNKDVIYATITGLDKNKLAAAYEHEETTEGVTSSIAGIKLEGKTIKFTDAELCGNKVTLDTKKSQSGYKLKVDEDVFKTTALSDGSGPTWTVSGTTATLKGKTDAGWAVTDTTITNVAASSSAVLAVVKGLKSGLKANTKNDKDEDGNAIGEAGVAIGTVSGGVFTEAGISVNGTVITLDEDVLNQGEVSIESSSGYILALGEVSEPTSGATGWELDTTASNTNTAVLKQGTSAGYTLEDDDKKIVYSQPSYTQNLTTITGLSKDVVLDDNQQLGLLDDDDNFTNVLIDEDGKATDTSLVDVDTESKEVKLNKAMLGDSDLTATQSYKIYLTDEDGTEGNIKQTDGTAWSSLNGTTAILKSYKTKSYAGNGSSKITYTADSYGTGILTLEGLKSGLSIKDNEIGVVDKKSGKFTKLVTVDNDNKIITVEADALDKKSDVVISNTNYKLELGDTAEKAEIDEAATGWKVPKAGQATYTEKTSAGYKVSDDGQTITYKSAGTSTTTINGLDSSSVPQNTKLQESISGISFGEENGYKNGTIELDDSILSTSNVTINSKDYVLAMGDLEKPAVSPDGLTYKYNGKSGTVTINGEIGKGWTLSSDSKTLLHTAASSGSTTDLVTISGLAKGLDHDAEGNEEITGLTFDKSTNTITLDTAILGTANVTLNQKNYKLALANTVPGRDGTAPEPETVWRINGTTATYKTVNPLYYTYDEAKNTIVYHKETDVKNSVLATITGLDKTKLAEAYSDGAFTQGIVHSVENSTITLDEDILGAADVKLTTPVSYKLYLAEGVPTPTYTKNWENITEWQTSGTTANYKTYNKAYYTLASDGKSVKYTKPTPGSIAATITGIKKDIDINDCYNTTTRTITLGEDQLGTSNVKITKGAGYSLALAQGIEAPKLNADTVKFISPDGKSKATLNGIVTAGYALTNEQLITYSAAKGTYGDTDAGTDAKLAVLATISGLGLNLDKNEEITSGITLETDNDGEIALDANGNATIIISDEDMFAGKDITVGKNDPYKLTFDTESFPDLVPTQGENEWDTKNNGTWTYQNGTSEGYTESTDGKTLKYSKAATTVLATVGGLIKNTESKYIATADDDKVTSEISSPDAKTLYLVTVDEDNNATVTPAAKLTEATFKNDGSVDVIGKVELLSKDIFAGTKITVGKNENYQLNSDEIAPEDFGDNPKWYVSGTKAELKSGKTSGYEADATGKNVNFVKEAPSTAVATITGLGKGLVVSTGAEFASNLEGATTVEAGIVGTIAKVDMVDADGDPVKINNKTVKVSVFTPGISVDSISSTLKEISLDNSVLGTTNVSLDGSDNFYYFTQTGVTDTSTGSALWTLKNGTATLKQTTYAGFTLNDDKNLFTYTPGKADAVLVTVSGLKKAELDGTTTDYDGLTATSSTNGISIDTSTNVITVKNSLLNAAKVTAKSGDKTKSYTLAMGDDVMQKNSDGRTNQTEWVTPVNGTTATYKTYDKGYYEYASVKGSEDQTTLNYVKETNGTAYATVSGLKKNASITSALFDEATKVVTITEDMLDKKNLTLKGDAYTFDASKLDDDYFTDYDYKGEWTVNNGTANYKAERMVGDNGGYTLSEDGKTFTYLKTSDKENRPTAIITITGLNKTTADIKNGVDVSRYNRGGVIKLDKDDLTTSTVKLTKGDGYTLALASDVSAATIDSAAWSAVKGGKATLSGVINEEGAGYELTPDKKSVIYTAASAKNRDGTYKNQNFATISGVKTTNTAITGNVDISTKKATMNGSDLSDKVTIGGTFAFEFARDYNNASITGSSASDSVNVVGSGVSVNTAAGDDFVTFTGDGGNTFFYASGNGNDTIASFSEDDKINVTNAAITAENIKVDDDDVVIAIGKGSIKLQDYASDHENITIFDKSKTATTYSWNNRQYAAQTGNSNSLIADDNYIAPTQDLSAIVSKSSNSIFAISDLNASQNLANLDKQSEVVAYSGDDK